MPSGLTRLVLLLLVLSGVAGLSAQDPPAGPLQGRGFGGRGVPRDTPDEPTGTAIIRGRVLGGDTGSPLRRAQVRAATSGVRGGRLVTTDVDGRFEIRDLPAGRWQITASKAGFVTMRFGQRRPFEAGRPIEVGDGQIVERADFALPRGAAITGRVFDEFGDPVAGARVQTLRYRLVQGSRVLSPTGVNAQSDDTGAFRLYGLMPGDYYVSAVLRALPVDDPDDATAYAPTYYPGTASVAEAQRIALSIGEETSVVFGLLPVRTTTISGTVIDSLGRPLTAGMIALMPAEGAAVAPGLGFGGGARVRADGSFTLGGVHPGTYTLVATDGIRRGGNVDAEMASMSVTVGGGDLSGLSLVTSPGATLDGVVVAARGSRETLRPNGIQVAAQGLGMQRDVGARPSRVDDEGTFTLTNLFGRRVLRVNGIPRGWMLFSIVVGGRDVTDTPLDFGPNQEVRGAQVVLTDRLTQVAGRVTTGGEPTRDYTAVIFPDDENLWAFPSRYVRAARPDQDGRFTIDAVPPHERYLAVAVDYLEDGEAGDPEFLSFIRSRATRFSLGDGESAAVELRLVER